MTDPLEEPSDSDLIARIQFGDDQDGSAAFGALFSRYGAALQDSVFYAARSRGFSVQEREDVVGETWVRARRGIKRFEDRGASLLTWLKKIAANVVYEYERRTYRLESLEQAREEPTAPGDPVQETIARLTRDEVKAAITAVVQEAPDDYQIIIQASFLTEPPMSVPEIMEMCEWTRGQLYTKKSRALDWLRKRLLDRYGASVIAGWLDAS